jgi:hypothetical protein
VVDRDAGVPRYDPQKETDTYVAAKMRTGNTERPMTLADCINLLYLDLFERGERHEPLPIAAYT